MFAPSTINLHVLQICRSSLLLLVSLEDDKMMPMDYEVEVREENDDRHQDDCEEDHDEEMAIETHKEESHEEKANEFAAAAALAARNPGEEPAAMMSMVAVVLLLHCHLVRSALVT